MKYTIKDFKIDMICAFVGVFLSGFGIGMCLTAFTPKTLFVLACCLGGMVILLFGASMTAFAIDRISTLPDSDSDFED